MDPVSVSNTNLQAWLELNLDTRNCVAGVQMFLLG